MNRREYEKDEQLTDMVMEEELEEWAELLDEFDVEYPDEAKMMQTIEAIRPFVPVKKSKWRPAYESVSALLRQSLHELLYISPLFWGLNSLFMIMGLLAVFISEENPYTILMILSPIPTLTGLVEIVKSRYMDMEELEMSFKYNLQEIILSKMVVIGGFNLFINVLLTVIISVFDQEIWMWKLILYWITPFTIITTISLLIVYRFRHVYAITMGLLMWIMFGGFISQFTEYIEKIPTIVYLLLTLIASILAIFQVTQIYKRGITYEYNHHESF
ncbi:hypothetical protein WAK64_14830 [Bacillus spongiae]|uniref:Uncharacterized protein n=1 Tax=Bacillus spongiae TaxID=2683610 RepID=A0ABU8HGE5_9BACI